MFNPVKSILLVEDQADTAVMLAEMLDLMLLDIPGLDGLRFIRSKPGTQDLPMVAISDRNLPADIQQGKDQGASDYLTKLVSYSVIKQTVDGFFSKKQVRQRL
jgi:CheY-like chemotaxis protein